ncbi:hypothetical protein BDV28DRAFT_131130 [Aspergillus coremiiformis]|uniref:Uncharacterized protein n=1 Tax=Aspergillus coremiiformis TaxID=138285 RepID=A0A5N6ZA99_9EURO|nr:hypothetical protein BDV28DRAFT_131130 [Aspergillus coremiiformis]
MNGGVADRMGSRPSVRWRRTSRRIYAFHRRQRATEIWGRHRWIAGSDMSSGQSTLRRSGYTRRIRSKTIPTWTLLCQVTFNLLAMAPNTN